MTRKSEDLGLHLPDSLEIRPQDLARLLEGGTPLQIMDVRAPARVERARIHLVPPERFHNVRGSDLMHHKDVASTGLDPDLPVAVICGHGKDSKILAFHLGRMGLDAKSLEGGMAAWTRLTVPRQLEPPEELDHLTQFDRIGKGCLGYLLISEGQALIVDPPLFFERYLEAVEESGARLVGVVDTHVHADYVSGASRLAESFGVPYYLHPADAVYPYDGTPGRIPFSPVGEGDVIQFGRARLTAVHTPGHTEGSVSYLLEDRLALTGDFLFVKSIGRPDLGGREEEWARNLWDSAGRTIRNWSHGMAVYPAHYATETERNADRTVGVPFGSLLTENEVLRVQDPEVFLHHVLSHKAPFPEAYRRIKAINLGLAPVTEPEVEELEMGRNECALGGT